MLQPDAGPHEPHFMRRLLRLRLDRIKLDKAQDMHLRVSLKLRSKTRK